MNRTDYTRYLKTSHWRTIARLARERDGDQCVICGNEFKLTVHHRTYDRCPYRERLGDVVTLCAGCHKLYEEDKRLRGVGW